MTYKCKDCGHIFEDCEVAHWKENRGEYWGQTCYEEYSGCPLCHGDYDETVRCEICGSEHLMDELFGGVCEKCINDHRNDFDACYSIYLGETESIRINALIAALLDESDINQILKEHIKNNFPEIDCSEIIDLDKDWFGEALAKEVKK